MDIQSPPGSISFPAANIRLITSAKGGVGKSTVCANLGAALAECGHRVLLIDCDIVNRCLDLLLGVQDETLWGIRDVILGDIPLSDAVCAVSAYPNLHLLPGSRFSDDDLPALTKGLGTCIADAVTLGYDHILIDTPGGLHDVLFAAAEAVSEALIISSAQSTAIRSAEQTAQLLCEHGLCQMRLIVNQFMAADALYGKSKSRRRTRAQNDAACTLISAVDAVSLSLLGVVPFDAALWDAQNHGRLITDSALTKSMFAQAHRNIAHRLIGHTVPLFSYKR